MVLKDDKGKRSQNCERRVLEVKGTTCLERTIRRIQCHLQVACVYRGRREPTYACREAVLIHFPHL